jgi:hypothetical protein
MRDDRSEMKDSNPAIIYHLSAIIYSEIGEMRNADGGAKPRVSYEFAWKIFLDTSTRFK